MARKHPKIYHCDGYYYQKVCPDRGMQDAADIRYGKFGLLRQRETCESYGMSPFKDYKELCIHCKEAQQLVRRINAK